MCWPGCAPRGSTWGHRSPAATHFPRPAHCPRISPDLESRRPGQFPPNHDTDRFNPTSPFQTLKYYKPKFSKNLKPKFSKNLKSKFSKNLNTSPTRHFPDLSRFFMSRKIQIYSTFSVFNSCEKLCSAIVLDQGLLMDD